MLIIAKYCNYAERVEIVMFEDNILIDYLGLTS